MRDNRIIVTIQRFEARGSPMLDHVICQDTRFLTQRFMPGVSLCSGTGSVHAAA